MTFEVGIMLIILQEKSTAYAASRFDVILGEEDYNVFLHVFPLVSVIDRIRENLSVYDRILEYCLIMPLLLWLLCY